MNFSLLEKMAVLKAVDEVLMADGHIDVGEIAYLTQILNQFDEEMEFIQEARSLKSAHASEILKSMNSSKKIALYVMMKDMGEADGKIDLEEWEVILSVLDIAGINL